LENDYQNLFERIADSTNENEIKEAIDEQFKDIPEEKREEIKKEIAPLTVVVNTLKISPEPKKRELGILAEESKVAFSYNSDESLKDPDKLQILKEQLKKLEEYTKGAGDKKSLFDSLNGDDQEEIKKLVKKVQARVAEMSKVQNIGPSKLPGISIPVTFGIIALAAAVGGVIFYFLQSVYGKEPEEVQ